MRIISKRIGVIQYLTPNKADISMLLYPRVIVAALTYNYVVPEVAVYFVMGN